MKDSIANQQLDSFSLPDNDKKSIISDLRILYNQPVQQQGVS